MANKFIIPAPPAVGVAASATATLDLPIGPRYHVAWLELNTTFGSTSGQTLAQALGLIKVKVNGRVQRQYSATQLNALNTLNGTAFRATFATAAAPNVIIGHYISPAARL